MNAPLPTWWIVRGCFLAASIQALTTSRINRRDRALRLSGLAFLLLCLLKLFLYDLRFLDTLPRIFSFIALGAILVAVSWIYTRFRERA